MTKFSQLLIGKTVPTASTLILSIYLMAIIPGSLAKVKCFDCTNMKPHCYESFACEGDFCQYVHKSDGKAEGGELFHKGCVNGKDIEAGCKGSAQIADETCYCNDRHFCNSALPHSQSASCLISAAFICLCRLLLL